MAEAPAKVILLGEHFCVHGASALSVAVNLYARVRVEAKPAVGLQVLGLEGFPSLVEAVKLGVQAVFQRAGKPLPSLEVRVSSEIPIGAGLGSSASIAAAAIAATLRLAGLTPSKDLVMDLCSIPERLIHGNPSGVDQATVILGGLIFFKRGEAWKLNPQPLSLVVGDTGERRSTGRLVERFGSLLAKKRGEYLAEAEELTLQALKALKEGNLEGLGEAMNKAQKLLSKFQLSTPKLDRLVEAALKGGALGAKLTGAGGGGCMVALTRPGEAGRVAEALRRAGGKPYMVEVDWEGLKVKP